MKVRIVCYEDVHKWIIGKFALKLQENLLLLGHEASIDYTIDENADVNHHIIFSGYSPQQHRGIQTLMITHIDSSVKSEQLSKQLQIADMGICMSHETLETLVNLQIQREKLCFINPAHDGIIKPKKSVVGLTCRVQEDGRKREYFLGRLSSHIDPEYFSFKIMGDGWDEQINILRGKGFHVEYFNSFDYPTYVQLIPSLDYYLYMGQDEGQMGFIDAVAAGIPTIVTLQGYHLDAHGGITYGFNTFEELVQQFQKILNEKKSHVAAVASWNWRDYTRKHLDVWNYLLDRNAKDFSYLHAFKDGISSIAEFDNQTVTRNKMKALKLRVKLYIGRIKQAYFIRLSRLKANNRV